MITGKKIFITGGAGFIGTALCRKLINENQVTVYDIMRPGRETLQQSDIKNNKNLKIISGDIMNKNLLISSIDKDTDIVLHLAAIAGVSSYYNEPEKTFKINLMGTMNILDAILEKGIKPELFVDFSTSETYGSNAHASEKNCLSLFPTTDDRGSYSIAKAASERLSFIYGKKHNFRVLIVKPFNVYGPGQLGEGAIANFIKSALKNETIKITGDGSAVRAWCYIDDFIECLLSAIENKDYLAEVLNIGNEHEIETTLSLAKKIIRLTKSNSKIEFIPHIGTEIEVRIPDISKAREKFNFNPQIDIEEGIKRTIAWISNP